MKVLSIIITFISTLLLLYGCVAATIVGTAVISTKIVTDPRTIGTQIDDSTLKLRINNALLKNKNLKEKAHVNVVTYQGKVLLIGQAPNPELLSCAEQIVIGIKNVKEIYNEIRQEKPVNYATILSDIWITIKVRSKLLSDSQIKFSKIKIITENGEVFLLGLVTENEGKIAADIASHINGVKRVMVAFDYTSK